MSLHPHRTHLQPLVMRSKQYYVPKCSCGATGPSTYEEDKASLWATAHALATMSWPIVEITIV